jgi:hypothetical protein
VEVPFLAALIGPVAIGAVALGLVWLTGLIVVLRGTIPVDRPRIIDAYGRAFPRRRGHPAVDASDRTQRWPEGDGDGSLPGVRRHRR